MALEKHMPYRLVDVVSSSSDCYLDEGIQSSHV